MRPVLACAFLLAACFRVVECQGQLLIQRWRDFEQSKSGRMFHTYIHDDNDDFSFFLSGRSSSWQLTFPKASNMESRILTAQYVMDRTD